MSLLRAILQLCGIPDQQPSYAPQPNYPGQPQQQGGVWFAHAYFFPSEESFRQVRTVITSAQRTLDICVYSITDNDLANAIIDAHRRGVRVRIISDDDQAKNKGSDTLRMRDMGIPLVFDNAPSFMHNKYAIADHAVIVTGSYNWTKGARQQNQENVVISNSPELVQSFSSNFDMLWRKFGGR